VNSALGLHLRPGSFSDRWVEYCREKEILFKGIDAFRPDFMQQVEGLEAFAWHWAHYDPRAAQMARQVTYALEAKGLVVFPDSATCWHYDDKVGQKYLLEAIGAPVPQSWVFYELKPALDWVDTAEFPKVFKLRGGAGSDNVRLVKNRAAARSLCRRAFGSGFPSSQSYFHDSATKIRRTRTAGSLVAKLHRAPSSILNAIRTSHALPRSRGYVYFQEFLPDNAFDTRVTVIGDRVFAFIRRNRPGDFRASGSGDLHYDLNSIDMACVRTAVSVARRLGAQSLAFDFLRDSESQPVIIETSYCYQAEAVFNSPGHWDDTLTWHEGHMWPQDAILEDVLDAVE
jgi:glutathione synthase/RimK-type ligase-like ATP-grasp enzyme